MLGLVALRTGKSRVCGSKRLNFSIIVIGPKIQTEYEELIYIYIYFNVWSIIPLVQYYTMTYCSHAMRANSQPHCQRKWDINFNLLSLTNEHCLFLRLVVFHYAYFVFFKRNRNWNIWWILVKQVHTCQALTNFSGARWPSAILSTSIMHGRRKHIVYHCNQRTQSFFSVSYCRVYPIYSDLF